MPSLRSRLIAFLMRNRNLVKLKGKDQDVDWSKYESVLKFRESVEAGAGKFGRLPGNVQVEPLEIGSMPAEWIRMAGEQQEQAMLYFHGGGYISGTCKAHRGIVAKFVLASRVPALLFEYRLAPENPFPAALDDALAAYQYMLDQGLEPQHIVFIGDSAGGGLLLASLLALRDRGLPLPAGAVAYSPVTDFTCSGKSYLANIKKCLSPPGMGLACGRHYAGGEDVTNPYISPLFGDLHGLPPLLLFAAGDETLRDDAARFADKADDAGVDVRLIVGEGLFHCYPAMAPLFPEAAEAMDKISAFIKQHIA